VTQHLADVAPVDRAREVCVRMVACPICSARAGSYCHYDGETEVCQSAYSHTGRYLAAVERGLVPAMPGEVTQ